CGEFVFSALEATSRQSVEISSPLNREAVVWFERAGNESPVAALRPVLQLFRKPILARFAKLAGPLRDQPRRYQNQNVSLAPANAGALLPACKLRPSSSPSPS